MRRPTSNLVIDAAAFAAFVLLTSTGTLMRYVLPPGSGQRTKIFGLDRHAFGEIHFWIAIVFLGILAMHLLVHRRWIATVLTGRPREGSGWRIALGLVGLLAVLAAALAPFLAEVETAPRGGLHLRDGRHGERPPAP